MAALIDEDAVAVQTRVEYHLRHYAPPEWRCAGTPGATGAECPIILSGLVAVGAADKLDRTPRQNATACSSRAPAWCMCVVAPAPWRVAYCGH